MTAQADDLPALRPRRGRWVAGAIAILLVAPLVTVSWRSGRAGTEASGHPAPRLPGLGGDTPHPGASRAVADRAMAAGRRAAAADAIREVADPVPSAITAELREERGGWRLTVRRPGHLVALRAGGARAAGQDWVGVRVEGDAISAEGAEPMVWETTDPATLATDRGLLRLVGDAVALEVRLSMAAPSPIAHRHAERRHVCETHGDGDGGFTVLCRLSAEARRVGVANVTDPRPLEDAWTMPLPKSTLVRLDLPVRPGEARARVIGYADGMTGVVVRAEATWLHGETEPSFTMISSARSQPAGTGFGG